MSSTSKPAKQKVQTVKWSVSSIETFLELFRDYPALWNTKSEEYHYTDHKDSSYKALRVALNEKGISVTEEQLKLKIKSIRSTYRSELTKIKLSKSSGSATTHVYVPKLSWFAKADEFLNEVTSFRKSRSNLELKNDEENQNGVVEEQIEPDETETRSSTPMTSVSQKSPSVTPKSSIRSVSSSSSTFTTSSNVNKKTKISPNIAALDKVVNTLQSISNRNVSSREDDEFDLYGKYIATTLRNLGAETAAILQTEIDKMISQAKLHSLGVIYE